jgi:hypothetical protein
MIQLLTNLNMPFYCINSNNGRSGTVPFRLDNFWTLEIGLCRQDWKLGDFWVNWENFGQLGDFWIFQIGDWMNFGQLGGTFGEWKIQNPNPIGNWTLEN